VIRSCAVALAGVVLLAACAPDEGATCDVSLGPGAFVNVVGRMPPMPFTVEACVAGADVPCAHARYRRCRPGKSCRYTLEDPPPGASRPHRVMLATMQLGLGDIEPQALEGRTATFTITGPDGTRTETTQFSYVPRGDCDGDQAFAEAQFRFPRTNDGVRSPAPG
jgi:hypothetical protein